MHDRGTLGRFGRKRGEINKKKANDQITSKGASLSRRLVAGGL